MNNNLVIISGITISLLIVILLFKLNKTKIEYDNKLLAINRKVRDLTNLVDLSNTKKNLIENSANLPQSQENVKMETIDKHDNIESSNKNNLENQYKDFVSTNENFFNNIENYDIPLDNEVKENIDNLVNSEQGLNDDVNVNGVDVEDVNDDTYKNLDEFSFEQADISNLEQNVNEPNEDLANQLNEFQDDLTVVGNKMNIEEYTQSDEMPQSSLDELNIVDNNNNEFNLDLNENEPEDETENSVDVVAEVEASILNNNNYDDEDEKMITLNELENMDMNNLYIELEMEESSELTFEEVKDVSESQEDNVEVENENDMNNNTSINFEDLENMSVKDLQEICRENKLKVKGRKDEIILRIKEFFSISKL